MQDHHARVNLQGNQEAYQGRSQVLEVLQFGQEVRETVQRVLERQVSVVIRTTFN